MLKITDWGFLHIKVVFVKDSILGNWPKYERRRQLTQIRAPEAREKSSAKREHERAPKARESAGGERRAQRAFRRRRKRFREAESSLCYYGQIPIAFKSRYLSKLDTPLHEEAQIYCPNWLSTQLEDPAAWARVSGIEFQKKSSSCMLILDIDLGPTMYLACMTMELEAIYVATDFEAMLSVQIVLTFFTLIYFLYFRAWNYLTYIMFRIRPRNEIVKDTDRSTNYQILWAKYGRWLKNRFLCNKYLKIVCF